MRNALISLEDALDDCLALIESGDATLEECLARYPQHAFRLKPILAAAEPFREARAMQAPAAFRNRNRAQLIAHIGQHPRGHKKAALPLLGIFQGGFRTAVSLGAVALAFVGVSTAAAQSAVPGEPLYPIKRVSESAWRAVSPDTLSVDIALSERRAEELIVVQGTAAETEALQGYQDSVVQVSQYQAEDQQPMVVEALASQQQELKESGVQVPVLDQVLIGLQITLDPSGLVSTLVPTDGQLLGLPTLDIKLPGNSTGTSTSGASTATMGVSTTAAATTGPQATATPPPAAASNTPVPVLPLPTLDLPPVVETAVPPVVSTVVGGVGGVVETLVPGINLPLP